jgi:hypothetical protein
MKTQRRPGIALLSAGLLAVSVVGLVAQARPATPVQTPAQPPVTPKAPASQGTRSDAALPTPRAIIDRHLTAIGGRAAVLARTSSHASGTVAMPSAGMTGNVDVYGAKPDKSLLRITLGGVGQIEEGFNGTVGWSLNPMTGPALTQGKELEQKKFDSDFLADLHLDARYESMTTLEKSDFEGRPCYKLRLVRRGGGEEFEFYDVQTGLKAGSITTRDSPMGPITATTVETDYRKFGPLLQATTIKSTAMGLQQVITLTTVEYDKVDPGTFDPPPAIKALVK